MAAPVEVARNSSSATATTITATVPASEVAPGDTLIVVCQAQLPAGFNATALACADSRGAVYTLEASAQRSTVAGGGIFTAEAAANADSGFTVTVTYPVTVVNRGIVVYKAPGYQPTPNETKSDAAGGFSTAPAEALPATTSAACLIFALLDWNSATTTLTPSSGYTAGTPLQLGGTLQTVWQEVAATGSYTPGGTLSASASWAGCAVALPAVPLPVDSFVAPQDLLLG